MKHHNTPTASLELITPDVATRMLADNHNNRSIRPRKVHVYAGEMQSGDWIVTGEGIKYDRNGRMFDGQHRLMAVVKAGVPVWMFVFRGLDPQAGTVVDTGAKRSPRDALRWAGHETESTALAAMAKVVILWDRGLLRRTLVGHGMEEVTATELVEWADEHSAEALNWIAAGNRIYNHGNGFPTISKATLAAALYLIAREDRDGAEWFAEELRSGRLPGRGHPLNTLHTRLTQAKVRRETIRTSGQLFLYFRTWNALAEGSDLFSLKIGKAGGGGDIAVPSPKSRRVVEDGAA